ncbi:hypothetical protein K502DRAFT_30254 [Neoconidiobolus thromboides FSU 785]|nr:hypothetical protein K502DRAFT_30254 [Neoconidiobolus thromboides FSU 785]
MRSRSYYNLWQSNLMTQTLLCSIFYLILSYQNNHYDNNKMYQLISLLSVGLSLFLSEYKLWFVNSNVKLYPWLFLFLSQFWLIINLDLSNQIFTIADLFLFLTSIGITFSCFFAVLC